MVKKTTILLLTSLGIFLSFIPTDHAGGSDRPLVLSEVKHPVEISQKITNEEIVELTPIPTDTPTPTPNIVKIPPKTISKVATTPNPTKIPSATPTPVKTPNNCVRIDRAILEPKVRAAFPEDPEAAVLIAGWESKWDNCVISKIDNNGRRNFGLFQINGVNCGSDEACMKYLDPDQNIAKARQLYLNRKNWSAWGVCYMLNPCR